MSKISDLNFTVQEVFPEIWDFPFLAKRTVNQSSSLSFSTPSAITLQHCTSCSLYLGRSKSVSFRGQTESETVFIGGFPTPDDDSSGQAFSGEEGNLLEKIILGLGYDPRKVLIGKITHCKPPKGLGTDSMEAQTCFHRHISAEILRHKRTRIFAFGKTAGQIFSQSSTTLNELRRQSITWNNIPVSVTLDLSALLENPDSKRDLWNDVKAHKHRG